MLFSIIDESCSGGADLRNAILHADGSCRGGACRGGALAPPVMDRRRATLKYRPYAILLFLSAMFLFVNIPVYAQSPSGKTAQAPARTNAVPITVTGEVVDTWCYSSHVMGEGRGPKHEKCARDCIAGGVAIGIVDDEGNLYIASKHRGYQGCLDLLIKYVAKRVTVTGWVAKGGKNAVPVLKITSVKPAA